MIKKMVRHFLANPLVRGCGRAVLAKYPKLRPYFFRLSRRLGLVQRLKVVRRPILQVESFQDISPRAAQIYLQLRKKALVATFLKESELQSAASGFSPFDGRGLVGHDDTMIAVKNNSGRKN